MDATTKLGTSKQSKELLDAQAHIWNHTFSIQKPMALKCAIQLGIPDAIQKHGKPITLNELTNSLAIHPTKAPSLKRLMRFLSHFNFFSTTKSPSKEVQYDLTTSSRLLLKDHPLTQSPFVLLVLDQIMTDPAHHFASWFVNNKDNDDECPFHVVHGKSIWDQASHVTEFNNRLNLAMASDAQFVASLLMANNTMSKALFEGLDSLVDVGGGNGSMAKAITKAYSGLKCIVFDLPHVIEGSQVNNNGGNLVYVAGDMFEAIPYANAVLLKWILHDWSDEDCIKILVQCKKAIPSKDLGGKVIIIDMVVENNVDVEDEDYSTTQILFDMELMSLTIGGKERTEKEWKKLFINAGFNYYKISHVLGLRSVIEVFV